MPATSEPASGSEQQYAANSSSLVRRDRYSFFCASVPATSSGVAPSMFAAIEVLMPEQPYDTSSWTRQSSRHEPPRPP